MKPSEILKRAEKYLWDGTGLYEGKYTYICCAIREVEREENTDAEFLYNYIDQALNRWASAVNWLMFQPGGIPINDSIYIQAWRLNWMRRMQKYFRSIGE